MDRFELHLNFYRISPVAISQISWKYDTVRTLLEATSQNFCFARTKIIKDLSESEIRLALFLVS